MNSLLFVVAAALASPQDACTLESVEPKEGACELTFKCPWPKGTALRLEFTRRTTHVSWAPRIEKDASGREFENVSLAIRQHSRDVHKDALQTEAEGGFTYAFKPKVPGVYHVAVIYDPGAQENVNPRFTRDNRTVHRIISLTPGQAETIILDDDKELLRFSKEFFQTLRAAIQKSDRDYEVEAVMRPLVEEVLRRGKTTQLPGCYSIMEHLSPYIMSEPKDPKRIGPNDPRKLTPNKIDIKTAHLPLAIVRETMILMIILMEDMLQEAALVAPLTTYVGDRREVVMRLSRELPEILKRLRKLEPVGKLTYIFRETHYARLVEDSCAAASTMLERRSADEAKLKELLPLLAGAAKAIGHPFDSIKE
jgi:hypothetical protein